jgi:DNA-binding transcriptional ArsR family regulator
MLRVGRGSAHGGLGVPALLEPMGLTHPQYLAMLALWGPEPLSVTELSRMLDLAPGALSWLLKRLEAADLVRRDRDRAADEQDVTPEEYTALIEVADLRATDLIAVAGERRAAGEPTLTHFSLNAGFQFDADEHELRYAFSGRARLADEEDRDYGEVSATVIVAYGIGDIRPSEACAEMFGDQSASMAAHPLRTRGAGSCGRLEPSTARICR